LLQGARRFVIESAPSEVAKKPVTKSASVVERESYDSIPTT